MKYLTDFKYAFIVPGSFLSLFNFAIQLLRKDEQIKYL